MVQEDFKIAIKLNEKALHRHIIPLFLIDLEIPSD